MVKVDIRNCAALDLIESLEDSSIDAIVTDPPAGIGFMGKSWDNQSAYNPRTDKGQAALDLCPQLGLKPWESGFTAFVADHFGAALAKLKPGGHALVWALPRTADLTGLGLRIAGFEIRDVVVHLFGSGFPKSLDIQKAIGGREDGARARSSKAWKGYGTALKPGSEHWILARKPVEGTITGNVLKWGTGALNIDACRVASGGEHKRGTVKAAHTGQTTSYQLSQSGFKATDHDGGRWPPNVVLTHSAGCECVGTTQVKASAPASGPTLEGSLNELQTASPRSWSGVKNTASYGGSNGLETIDKWQCVDGCPVKEIGDQSGERSTGSLERVSTGFFGGGKERSNIGYLGGS